MAKQTITLGLSQKSVEKALKQLRQYKQWIRNKTTELVKALAEIGIPVIETNVADASYTFDSKGVRSGSNTEHYTYVKLNNFGSYSQANLVVEGEEILFIEFGAGVYYNGEPGTSPHPKGQEFGFLIGSYGVGHGVQKVWGYYDETGALVMTHGVEATMPVLKAYEKIIADYVSVARRVFGNG